MNDYSRHKKEDLDQNEHAVTSMMILMKSTVILRWSSESSKFWREGASRKVDQVVRNKVVTLVTPKTDLKKLVKVSVRRQIHGERDKKTELLEWEAGASEIREEGHEVCCDDEDAEMWINMSREDN